MNTKSKIKETEFLNQFNSLFQYSKEEIIENEAFVLHMKIMSAVEKKMLEKGWKRKDLAKAVDTSASYITQLFRGDRMVNFTMVAKFQDALGGEFNITWCNKGEDIHFLKSIKNNNSQNKTFVLPSNTLENIEEASIYAA